MAAGFGRLNLDKLPDWRQIQEGDKGDDSKPAIWSGKNPPPAIGSRVNVLMNAFGPSTVVAYAVHFGYLGVHVRPDKRPDWHVKQNPGRDVILVFGAEIGENL